MRALLMLVFALDFHVARADVAAGHWSPTEPVPGTPSSTPAVAWSQFLERVTVFYRGDHDHLWHVSRDVATSHWGTPVEVPSLTLASAPTATWFGTTDRVYLFYRGTDDALWFVTWWDDHHDGTWSVPQKLAATGLVGGPAVAVHWPATADLDVYYPGPGGHLWRIRGAGTTWSTPIDLGVTTAEPPAIVAADDRHRSVFYRGSEGTLWQIDGVDGVDLDPHRTQWSAPVARVTGTTSAPAATLIPGRAYSPTLATGGVAWRNAAGHLATATTTNGTFSETLDLGDISKPEAPALVWLPPFSRTESVELYFLRSGGLFRKFWNVPATYDLVWEATDDRGTARDPAWGWQVLHGGLHRPSQAICLEPWGQPCTTQSPKQARLDCGWSPGHVYRDGSTGAGAAVYTGRVYWENHSPANGADDDYNLRLVSPSHAGETTSDELGILLEFDSDETIDHFRTPAWSTLHAAVDAGDSFDKIHRLIDGADVVALGNPDLDCVHSCGMELHPVWALAIHVKDDPGDDVWAMFYRNWGNKGFCGRQQYQLQTDSMTLRLPWRADARSVAVADDRQFLTNDVAEVWGPYVAPIPGVGVDVAFHLGTPSASGFAEGELHLRWERGAPPAIGPTGRGVRGFGGPALGTISAAPPQPAACPADADTEEQADQIIRSLTRDQARRFESLIAEPEREQRTVAVTRPARPAPAGTALAVLVAPDPELVRRHTRRITALGTVVDRDLSPLLGVGPARSGSPGGPALPAWVIVVIAVLGTTVVGLLIALIRGRRR